MSIGEGAYANLVAWDDNEVVYEYGGYTFNDKRFRNENNLMDGVITIQRKCFAEPRKLRPKEVYTAGNLYADDNRIGRHISDRKTGPFSNSEERLEVPTSERNGQTHKEYCKGYGCRQNGRDNL